MKKLLFVMLMCIGYCSAIGQKNPDQIVLKSGDIINCTITGVDSKLYVLKFVLKSEVKQIDLNLVASYLWDGVPNKGLAGTGEATKADSIAAGSFTINTNSDNDSPGKSLIMFSNTAQTGIFLMFTGSIITALPAILKTDGKDAEAINDRNRLFTTVGLVTSGVGFIFYFASFSNVRKAGRAIEINDLISLNATNDGIGIVVPIK